MNFYLIHRHFNSVQPCRKSLRYGIVCVCVCVCVCACDCTGHSIVSALVGDAEDGFALYRLG